MTVKLHEISTIEPRFVEYFLYQQLEERDVNLSISHKEMPSWEKHVEFIKNHPYKLWWLIEDIREKLVGDDIYIGNIYLSRKNEIGIFMTKAHQRKGYAKEAVQQVMSKFPKLEFYANINPRNEASINLFEGLGFKHIQNTYRR